MHVLLLTDSYPNAYLQGQGSFVHDQALCLVSQGMKVGVISVIPVSWNQLLRRGFHSLGFTAQHDQGISRLQLCYAQVPRLYRYPIYRILYSGKRMVRKYIGESGKPDVIHVHGFHCAALALWMAREYAIPLVVTEHNSRILAGTLEAGRLKWAVDLYRHADVRIGVSGALAHRMEQLSGRPVEVVPNVVDTAQFVPGIPAKECVFLSAGNFTQNKNQRLQLEAFKQVHHLMPDARLWLVGDGEMLSECKRYAKENGLDEQVTFFGRLSRESLLERMQQAKFFLISSKHETFGVVAIEAMACGLHVISTRCGGPEDSLSEHGVLTEHGVSEFSSAMLQAYNRRAEFPSMKLHDFAEQRFGYIAVATQLQGLYSHVINQS
jgi:glycosyltransferase involved in cell wall biosynthesis